jgi:hypothetical protein
VGSLPPARLQHVRTSPSVQRGGRLCPGGAHGWRWYRGTDWPPAQPLGIGRGVICTRYHVTWQGLGEDQRGGGSQLTAEQAGRAVRFERQRPPGSAAGMDLGEFRLGPRRPAGRKAADPPPLANRSPAGWPGDVRARWAERAGRAETVRAMTPWTRSHGPRADHPFRVISGPRLACLLAGEVAGCLLAPQRYWERDAR